MKLKTYLKTHKLSIKKFSKLVGLSPSTIENYVYKDAIPSLVAAHHITNGTNGEISYLDLIPTRYILQKNKKDKLATWKNL